MKIVCLLRSLEMGGVERQLTGLASFLKQEGHEVVILKYLPDNFYGDFVRENHIPVVQLKKSTGYFCMARRIADFVRENGTDLVISFGASPNIKACIAKKIYGNFKLIVSERNFNVRWWPTDKLRFIAYREAVAIVSNSISQGKLICEKFKTDRYGIAEKSSTIVNFTDLERFYPQPRKDGDGRVFNIVTTGRIVRRKNIHGYIRAAKLLKEKGYDFNIRWYGLIGGTSYYRSCMRSIRKYGLEDMFRIYPAQKRVEDVYHEADVFCLPSFYEGTSNAISEALACGLPVVCSAVSDNSINVQEGTNGWLFDPTDIKSMTDAFERMFGSEADTLRIYGENSRRIAEERLSVDRFTRQYQELIGRIAGQNL